MSDSANTPETPPASGGVTPPASAAGGSAKPSSGDDPDPAASPAPGGDDGLPDGETDLQKRRHSRQDKIIQAYITDSKVFLAVASTDPQIRPLLEARGYDAGEFATGLGLVTSAQAAFADRAGGMGDQKAGTEALLDKNQTVRDQYACFRTIARAVFSGKADRLALSLTGDVPEDTSRFITLATASYAAAKKAPYDAKLARRGYTAADLDQQLAALETLTATVAGHDETQGEAMADTAARDTAYAKLKEYMKELKGVARGTLRNQPALLAKLGL